MAETRSPHARRRAALLLASALMIGAPAIGQGPLPPIPGPFPVIPGAGTGAQAPMPIPPAALDRPQMADRPERPAFQPPVNAMRLPYWMQPPVAPATDDTAATAAAETPAPAASAAPAPARTGVPQVPPRTGFIVPMPSWAGPGYGPQGYGAQGYAQQGYGPQASWPGQAPFAAAPGYFAPQGATGPTQGWEQAAPAPAWPQQPGWVAGPAPGWAPAPYGPVPGWGGGWAAPVTGAGQ